MDYRRFGDTIVARFDKGEEISGQLKAICEKEKITLASVQAIGATDDLTLGIFNPYTKEYNTLHFGGKNYEILSLNGTVNTKDGGYYSHLHISISDETGQAYGGHFVSGVISVTMEMVIRPIDGTVERKLNDEIGINLYHFI